MGFKSWVDSYGFETKQRIEDVNAIYRGGTNALSLLRTYHVDYIIVSKYERSMPGFNDPWLHNTFQTIATYNDTEVLAVPQ